MILYKALLKGPRTRVGQQMLCRQQVGRRKAQVVTAHDRGTDVWQVVIKVDVHVDLPCMHVASSCSSTPVAPRHVPAQSQHSPGRASSCSSTVPVATPTGSGVLSDTGLLSLSVSCKKSIRELILFGDALDATELVLFRWLPHCCNISAWCRGVPQRSTDVVNK